MGPLAVVNPKPGVGQGAPLRDGLKEVRVQHLGSITPIEALNVGVLIWLARLDVVRGDAVLRTPIDKRLGGEFRAVVPSTKEVMTGQLLL